MFAVISRRQFLQSVATALVGAMSFGGYAVAVEPVIRLRLQRHQLALPNWPSGLNLTIAIVADLHACEPWMTPRRIADIVAVAQASEPDLIVLLGDYRTSHRFVTGQVRMAEWAGVLGGLGAPLGVHAILGNHDWWEDRTAQLSRHGPVGARRALEDVGIPVYENGVVRLEKSGHGFWLAGLGDQLAFLPRRPGGSFAGVDDLGATLTKVTDDAPVILMAHEPDVFPRVPERVALTLSGHTHGGQVRFFGYSPLVPSSYGNRFAYGHITEKRPQDSSPRHLVVSGGLGCSIMPVRFGVPPEITLVEVGAA